MLDEARETRRQLERFIAEEVSAGLGRQEAVEKLKKEVAFTHLNRLVAFKMFESRRLIRGTINNYQNSNAFKLYLTEDIHTEDLARYEAGSLPQNVMGEGPSDIAYRHFLLWQCEQISKEVKILFDPENLASRLFPRPRVLREIIDLLNDPLLEMEKIFDSDETIGWVYQYFNEQEKEEVFGRLYKQKQKVRKEDIPAATQLFTPRWIVSWLVQNTLGRLWLQMHPASQLANQLDYLVPFGGEIPRIPLKNVQDIEVLDPACGTMHFGLVAFDLLVEMYKEEIERAGSVGWPEEPSVRQVEDIPAAIIEHNLFGIDIDLRAVQLSALTLYLKAKSLSPSTRIEQSNLACADVLLLNGKRLDEFLKAMQFSRPIYERVIRALWSSLRNASYAGSLLRLEEEIQGLIRRERERFRREGEGRLPFPELQELFEEGANDEEFWIILEGQIIQAFDEFARQQAGQGVDETFFAGEATKGMRLLDIMLKRYDIVLTNPPYMGNGNLNKTMGEFLKSAYPISSGDLFAAFIQRCMEFLKIEGRLGMITQQSFMFISSYENLRKHILQHMVIETLAHLGPHAFEEIKGEKVNTVMFAMRSEPSFIRREEAVGTYFRLVQGEGKEKEDAFRESLQQLKAKLPGLKGLWAGLQITKEDIAEARKNMLREGDK